MMRKAKINVLKLIILFGMSSLACEAGASWSNTLSISLSNASCSKVTKEIVTKKSSLKTVHVPQDIHGQYELTADNKSPSSSTVPTTYYLCWTNTSDNLIMPKLQGTFAKLDPTAWIFSRVFGGMAMNITYTNGDSQNFPCSDDTSIAYIETSGYSWCNKIPTDDLSTWGGKNGWNAWSIEDSSLFTFSSNWESINLQEREFPNFWSNWQDGVGITLYHRTYSSGPNSLSVK